MPASKAQQKAVNKYMREKYDRVNLTMPKGKKEQVQAYAEQQGESVNGFINRAIEEAMTTQSPETPVFSPNTAEDVGGITLSVDAMKTAQNAAKSAGETLPAFMERAITTQAERDKRAAALNARLPKKGE